MLVPPRKKRVALKDLCVDTYVSSFLVKFWDYSAVFGLPNSDKAPLNEHLVHGLKSMLSCMQE